MHDWLFAHPKRLDSRSILEVVGTCGIDERLFKECMTSDAAGPVDADVATGRRLGVAATPTCFVGRIENDGRVKVARVIVGIRTLEEFSALLDELLLDVSVR